MKYATVSIQVPEMMENFVSFSNPNDLLMRNALILYPRIKNLEISHGRAAELLGISKWQLIELYGDLGIPYISITPEELDEELENFKILEKSKL